MKLKAEKKFTAAEVVFITAMACLHIFFFSEVQIYDPSYSHLYLLTIYDDDDDGVAQHGGHTPNNRLTDRHAALVYCVLLLVLDIHVMINCHLSKKRYPLTSIT